MDMAGRLLAELRSSPENSPSCLVASETIPTQSDNDDKSDENEGGDATEEDGDDHSSLFLSDPEDNEEENNRTLVDEPIDDCPAEAIKDNHQRRNRDAAAIAENVAFFEKKSREIPEFSEAWEIVLEFQREGFDSRIAISNTGKQYWKNGDGQFTRMTEDEVDDLLDWSDETNALPVWLKPGFFEDEADYTPVVVVDTPATIKMVESEPEEEEVGGNAEEPCTEDNGYSDSDEDNDEDENIQVFYSTDDEDEDEDEQPWHSLRLTGLLNPSWTQHSSVDRETGHIFVIRDRANERDLAAGTYRDPKPHTWVALPTPPTLLADKRPGGQSVPALTVTSPEGVTGWLEDMAYYPGHVNWADLLDSDDEEIL